MTDGVKQSGENHLRYLDSARGIASLMVFVMHFFEAKYVGTRTNTWISFAINGRDAVSFFFVLSGFVLSYKYLILKKPLDIRKFFVSRLFRLWPGYILAVVLTVVTILYIQNNLTLHQLKLSFLKNDSHIWEELLLFRFNNNFYGAGWTLTIEMVASFMLPFFLIVAMKDIRLIKYCIFVYLIVIGNNFFFASHFMAGMLICYYFPLINKEELSVKKWFRYRYLFIVMAFVLFPYRYYDQLWPMNASYKYWIHFLGFDDFVFSGIAAAIFLVAIIYYRGIQRFFETRVLVFFGKISYSLYLLHPSVVIFVYKVITPLLQIQGEYRLLAAEGVIAATLCFSLSALTYYGFERPFINLGKKLASRLKPSVIIQNQ